MVWGVLQGPTGAQGSRDASLYLHIRVAGNGVAFHVTAGFKALNDQEWGPLKFQMSAGPYGPFAAASDAVEKVQMRWQKPQSPVVGEVHIAYSNVYNRRFRWRQPMKLITVPGDPTHVYELMEEDRPFRERA